MKKTLKHLISLALSFAMAITSSVPIFAIGDVESTETATESVSAYDGYVPIARQSSSERSLEIIAEYEAELAEKIDENEKIHEDYLEEREELLSADSEERSLAIENGMTADGETG